MNFIVCANYLFISVVSVKLSGYVQYKVSIKKKKMKKWTNYNDICTSWSYVSRNLALDLRASIVEDIEYLFAFWSNFKLVH